MMFPYERILLEKGRVDPLLRENAVHRLWIVDERIDRRIRIQLREGLKHPLRPTVLHQIVMDQRDLHNFQSITCSYCAYFQAGAQVMKISISPSQ